VTTVTPDLDRWIGSPAMRVSHRRGSSASPELLWRCAQDVRVRDTGLLGRLVRWRLPGTPLELRFGELFRQPPFVVLEDDHELALLSGMVGRIWTLRRDYPSLAGPDEFLEWSQQGTAKVVFAHWVEVLDDGRCALASESRVQPVGVQGRFGVRAVRPLVRAFGHLVGSEGVAAAVRLAESG